ncbi:hypothetical protein GGX14DRAFT_406423 [Mycena pura]|uniref:Uncharacterized protein n=1 Tax=Mycena pura TaxID=153505 RepID=A0AAD6UPZ4_9AGAR|nr:hypothetical protein GGX14DRAFT_406423 [Mycena pura]
MIKPSGRSPIWGSGISRLEASGFACRSMSSLRLSTTVATTPEDPVLAVPDSAVIGAHPPQLQLSPARRTLESITLYPPGGESYYAPELWIHVDEMLADVATYPYLSSIVISMEDAFPGHFSTLAWNCKSMPWVHEHLRRCSDRDLLRVDIPKNKDI